MVRQKWYKAMPVEARNKEKGRVVIQWKIQRDGTVREDDIVLTTAFARDPLVGAAFAAIRAAAPFPGRIRLLKCVSSFFTTCRSACQAATSTPKLALAHLRSKCGRRVSFELEAIRPLTTAGTALAV
jgi:hypothetical protein